MNTELSPLFLKEVTEDINRKALEGGKIKPWEKITVELSVSGEKPEIRHDKTFLNLSLDAAGIPGRIIYPAKYGESRRFRVEWLITTRVIVRINTNQVRLYIHYNFHGWERQKGIGESTISDTVKVLAKYGYKMREVSSEEELRNLRAEEEDLDKLLLPEKYKSLIF